MSEMDVDEEIETKDEDTFSNSPEGSSDDEDADEEKIRLKQKEFAYVRFKDEAAATNAIVKTDGTQIEDKIISVAISNPPPRKPKKEFSNVTIADSLGGGGSSKGPRGRGRTQLSLLPRSVVRSPAVKASSASNGTVQNGQSSEPMDSSEDKKPLSNSDFAKMLRK
ncbi:hypothetical protein AVEN_187505-1 [Araneus ventricosus]|uniref:RRM domain-containing protein n=1 Tax=Araneus ventricosus TaxID=182803 RepID=A0A4Y2BTR6_ARAVE|nr:hypothetical protein AVEN_187505-1 [Araneus ventricosus]